MCKHHTESSVHTHEVTHMHAQCPHVHSWQTLEVCEGRIQSPFRVLRPVTSVEPLPGPGLLRTPHFWQASGAPTPSGSFFTPSPQSSLSLPSHIPYRKAPAKIPSRVPPHMGAKPTRPLLQEGRDCVALFMSHPQDRAQDRTAGPL